MLCSLLQAMQIHSKESEVVQMSLNLNQNSNQNLDQKLNQNLDQKLNLKSISDNELIKETLNLVQKERVLLTAVIHYLREINQRRLYSAYGYKSLFDFTTKYLGYNEAQAYRRISAMKLLKDLPEIEEKITQGKIHLSHISIAQTHFKQEKKIHNKELSHQEKLSLIKQIENTSSKKAQSIVISLSSSPEVLKRRDQVNSISTDHIELKFIANEELQSKIEKLRGLLAHQCPELTLGELFNRLCDLGLNEWDPRKTFAAKKRCVKKDSLNNQANQEAKLNNDTNESADANAILQLGPKGPLAVQPSLIQSVPIEEREARV